MFAVPVLKTNCLESLTPPAPPQAEKVFVLNTSCAVSLILLTASTDMIFCSFPALVVNIWSLRGHHEEAVAK